MLTTPGNVQALTVTITLLALAPGAAASAPDPPGPAAAAAAEVRSVAQSAVRAARPASLFADVPDDHPFRPFIERLYELNITSGCATDPLRFCPDQPVTRAQMAKFILRSKYGPSYAPPPATGTRFVDVPLTHPFVRFIEQLAAENITSGCATDPPRFCPDDAVTRAQMAKFLPRSKYGGTYAAPPAPAALFDDVPESNVFRRWIHQIARERITTGCSANPPLYCPEQPVTRGQMAVFLGRSFNLLPPADAEWRQHGHDPQRTGYTPQVVAPPWQWRWAWNGVGPGGQVAKVTTGGSLPRNVQPVTGEGRVYVAAGVDGVFALAETTGAQVWQRSGIGDIRSTVAYDPATAAVFAVSASGVVFKLRASDGAVLAQHTLGMSSPLPLPPLLLADRVVVAMGTRVTALTTADLTPLWVYNAGATVATPPSYSVSRDVVIVASEPDLFVHAIANWDGSQRWRVRPVHPSRSFSDPTEFRLGWPVVADNTGLVLVKVRLPWTLMWTPWPQTNPEMRQFLTNNPGHQALFALDLDDGSVPFIANVAHGGYGDNDYLPMGPQPVVKRLVHGREIGYGIIRGTHAYDSRWDSHFGEIVLDSVTVPGYEGGDVRFIAFDWPPGYANPYLLTDEQPNVSVAGDYLFGGHWEAGFALKVLDRSPARGTWLEKITSQRLATVVTSQDDTAACAFSPSHYCASGLYNTRPYDFGFYIYYNQGAVYDQYWSEYAVWVVSNDNLYFRSADGAIVALTSGDPQAAAAAPAVAPAAPPDPAEAFPVATIPHTEARAWAGHTVTITGTLSYVFNNGKQVLLAFARPHQGTYKALIPRSAWGRFPVAPERLCPAGSLVHVIGKIAWYQGDPVTYVTSPEQLHCEEAAARRSDDAR